MKTNFKNQEDLSGKSLKNRSVGFFVTIAISLSLQAQDYPFDNCIDLFHDGETLQTVDCLSNYIKEKPKDVDALLLRAICYFYLQEYEFALSDMDCAIKYHTKKAVAKKDYLYGIRANFHSNFEKFEEALKDYSEAIKINPKNIDALYDRSYLYTILENYSASIDDLNKILKIDKDNFKAQIGLCINMIAQIQFNEAINKLDSLEKLYPNYEILYELRNEINAQKEDTKMALESIQSDFIPQSDYENKLRFAAEQGDMEAQCDLGTLYYNREVESNNFEQAVYWYRKAAEQEFAAAQYYLGNCYFYSIGLNKNYEQAVYWYNKAAEQGHIEAQAVLGNCYENGDGVNKNEEQAIFWYRKAAEQGYAPAQNRLGYCYDLGKGINKNSEQAVFWYSKAAEQGNIAAQINLAICYKSGSGVNKNEKQALYWYRKAAEQGDAESQNLIGLFFVYGEMGVIQDYNEAAYWFKKSADLGYAEGQYHLGICYENGLGVIKSKEKAAYWYRKAAEKGYLEAQEKLKNL